MVTMNNHTAGMLNRSNQVGGGTFSEFISNETSFHDNFDGNQEIEKQLNFSNSLHESSHFVAGPRFSSATMAADTAGPSEEPETLKRTHPCTWPNCGKFFLRKTDVTRHLRIHLNERPYPCEWPDCGKSFMQRSAMKIHYRTHTGEKPNKCPFEGCEKSFNDSSSLARHRRTHCFDEPFPCSYRPCDKHFKNRKSLVEHERLVHNAPIPPTRKASIKMSTKSSSVLPTPNATPDTTSTLSENPQFMFRPSSFNNNLAFHSNNQGAPILVPLTNPNQAHQQNSDTTKAPMASFSLSPNPKRAKNETYEMQQHQLMQDSRLQQNRSHSFSQSLDAPYPSQSAFHEEFMAQKQRASSSVLLDYTGHPQPSKQHAQQCQLVMSNHQGDQPYHHGLNSLPIAFDPRACFSNSPSVSLPPHPPLPKLTSLLSYPQEHHQQYPTHRASFSASTRDLSYSMNEANDAGESSFLESFPPLQQQSIFFDYSDHPPLLFRQKSRPPRIQTEFPAMNPSTFPSRPTDTSSSSFANPFRSVSFSARGDGEGREGGNSMGGSITDFSGPQTAREAIGEASHFSPLFPPRTTDGFMGFNGFNF